MGVYLSIISPEEPGRVARFGGAGVCIATRGGCVHTRGRNQEGSVRRPGQAPEKSRHGFVAEQVRLLVRLLGRTRAAAAAAAPVSWCVAALFHHSTAAGSSLALIANDHCASA